MAAVSREISDLSQMDKQRFLVRTDPADHTRFLLLQNDRCVSADSHNVIKVH